MDLGMRVREDLAKQLGLLVITNVELAAENEMLKLLVKQLEQSAEN